MEIKLSSYIKILDVMPDCIQEPKTVARENVVIATTWGQRRSLNKQLKISNIYNWNLLNCCFITKKYEIKLLFCVSVFLP